jgi:hypothetical protein
MGGEAKRRKAWVASGGEDWGRTGVRGHGTARQNDWRGTDQRAAINAMQEAAAKFVNLEAEAEVHERMQEAATAALDRNAALRRAGRNRSMLVSRTRRG